MYYMYVTKGQVCLRLLNFSHIFLLVLSRTFIIWLLGNRIRPLPYRGHAVHMPFTWPWPADDYYHQHSYVYQKYLIVSLDKRKNIFHTCPALPAYLALYPGGGGGGGGGGRGGRGRGGRGSLATWLCSTRLVTAKYSDLNVIPLLPTVKWCKIFGGWLQLCHTTPTSGTSKGAQ